MDVGVLGVDKALLFSPIVIRVEGVSGLPSCFDEGIEEFHSIAAEGCLQRTRCAAKLARRAFPVFRLAEIGQHAFPVPAFIAELTPFIVVAMVPAAIHLAVDRGTAAENPTARQRHLISPQFRFRLRAELPVNAAADHEDLASRHVDEWVPVSGASLQKQNTNVPIFAQAGRQHAAGGAGADDDIVKAGPFGGRHGPPNQISVRLCCAQAASDRALWTSP